MKIIITEGQVNLLRENKDVKKLKRFFSNLLGEDFFNTIIPIDSYDDIPSSFDMPRGLFDQMIDYDGPIYYFVINGLPYVYMDMGRYEWFFDPYGRTLRLRHIESMLEYKISDLGYRFRDVIALSNEGEPLNESVDKNKKFLINVMGEDLTGKIKEIKDVSDIPKIFHKFFDLSGVKRQMEMVGPMYLVKIRGDYYLYQDQSNFYRSHNDTSFGEMFIHENGKRDHSGKIIEELGIADMGLKFSDVIDIFYNQEGEPLNEEDDKPDWLRENTKVENLLKKVLEGKEFEFSFDDKWQDLDGNIEKYTFHYRMEVINALGVGSDTVARINVIIDDILMDGESVYRGWAEIGYSNSVWYIGDLQGHLNKEIFEVFPFSTYLNFYGYDEEKTLNENVNGNEKIKKLLRKVLENKEFVYSFEDTSWDGTIIKEYTIEYHIEVGENVHGAGSDAVAGISVIIDKILMNGEDFYYDWADSDYSENVWYIDYLHDHLANEVLDLFPFSIYPTFYGHDEGEKNLNESVEGSEKIKNLLKKTLEDQEFEISFEIDLPDFDISLDWDEYGIDSMTGNYTIKFYIKVGDITGEGSNAVASVAIIILGIEKDGEDFYYDWVNNDYSEYVWYINDFDFKLRDDILSDFPFKVHPTYYGYDEIKKS